MLRELVPSKANDEAFERWVGRYLRQSASPKAAAALLRMNTQIDVREVLPAIRVPTILIYRTDDADVHVDEGRYIAERIPGAWFVELPGADHTMWTGDADGDPGRDRGVPDRRPARTRTRSRARDGAVHRRRRLDGARDPPWRPRLAEPARPAPRRRSDASSSAGAAGRWTPPATASSRPSTVPPGRSDARSRRSTRSADSGCRSGPASTRARSRSPNGDLAGHRGPHRLARLGPRGPRRGPGLANGRRPRGRLRHRRWPNAASTS